MGGYGGRLRLPSQQGNGIPGDVVFSQPVVCTGGGLYSVVPALPLDGHSRRMIGASLAEFMQERAAVDSMLR